MIVAFLEVGLSMVWLLCDAASRVRVATWLVASPSSVWGEHKLWTLATSPLLETSFLSLLLQGLVLLTLMPTLERFWGTPRFLRFAVATSLAATVAGTLFGVLIDQDFPISGLDPLVYASIVAFGTIYKTKPVQFFAVLPMTGRQLMYGFLGFGALFVVLQGLWVQGVAFAAAIAMAALLLSHRFSPSILWKRWRLKRLRSHLKVVRDEPGKWLN